MTMSVTLDASVDTHEDAVDVANKLDELTTVDRVIVTPKTLVVSVSTPKPDVFRALDAPDVLDLDNVRIKPNGTWSTGVKFYVARGRRA